MYRVMATEHFDAAHHLRDYVGKCSQPHGHRWVVQVTVSGRNLGDTGMLIDFGKIKTRLNDILYDYDHHDLNEVEPFDAKLNPTAENLAKVIYDLFSAPVLYRVEKVRVYESPDCWAEYSI